MKKADLATGKLMTLNYDPYVQFEKSTNSFTFES